MQEFEFQIILSQFDNTAAFNDFLEWFSDVKKRRKQSYLDSQKCFPMERTSGTVTVKTENSLNTSWNSVQD